MASSATDSNREKSTLNVLAETLFRQVRFPTLSRGVVEFLVFCCVFLVAGYVSLGYSLREMLVPMVPVVFIMMISMVASGVYRQEITNCIINVYVHSAYGFLLASVVFLIASPWIVPEYSNLKFKFFFLFSAFFVINTMRPLISGTDFMDGGGRRGN